MRTPITTWYSERTEVTSAYNERDWVKFIATEAFDFLMTEDDNYLVTEDSLLSSYGTRIPVTTNY